MNIISLSKGLNMRMGTKLGSNIRFEKQKQEDLWRKNVEDLLSKGVTVKLFISVTQDTIEIELLSY